MLYYIEFSQQSEKSSILLSNLFCFLWFCFLITNKIRHGASFIVCLDWLGNSDKGMAHPQQWQWRRTWCTASRMDVRLPSPESFVLLLFFGLSFKWYTYFLQWSQTLCKKKQDKNKWTNKKILNRIGSVYQIAVWIFQRLLFVSNKK